MTAMRATVKQQGVLKGDFTSPVEARLQADNTAARAILFSSNTSVPADKRKYTSRDAFDSQKTLTCVSIIECVLKAQGAHDLLHLLHITASLLLRLRLDQASNTRSGEYIHQEERCRLGFRGNLQALGVAQGGLGQGLQDWG